MSGDLGDGKLPNGKRMRAKFLVLLAMATPGIPEYLTGSWKLSTLVSNPLGFIFFLAMNIGLYTMGALLIREFAVAYRKGWFSIFMLGCAYGIMEEAIALHTFFQVSGSPVGFLGTYGRFAGVDWVWAFGLAVFHAVFSITLPLLLLSTAYPRLSGRRVTGKKGIITASVIYIMSVAILNFVVNHTSSRPVPTLIEYLFFLSISAVLVIAAYLIPGKAFHARGRGSTNPFMLYILGFLVYPVYNIFAFIPINPAVMTRIPPILDILIHLALFGLILAAIVFSMPENGNRLHKFALAAGLVTPVIIESLKLELDRVAPLIGIISLLAAALLIGLWQGIQKDTKKSVVENASL